MTAVYILLGIWGSLLAFYTLYIAAINIWEERANISLWILIPCSPMMAVMLTVDFLMQISLFTGVFLDLPRDWLVTDRLRRYREQTTPDWRSRWATAICTRALNPFDPTKQHC